MTTPTEVREVLASVTDPEIPVVTIEDLGILRDVSVEGDRVTVTVTPTYSGCPAMDEIRTDIRSALSARGIDRVEVRTVLSPAWTTDWLSERGRHRLREHGIAPPTPRRSGPVLVQLGRSPAAAPAPTAHGVECPHCGSGETEEMTRFSSTSCKALWRCRDCREPFDHFKAH